MPKSRANRASWVSVPNFEDWRAQSTVFEHLAAVDYGSFSVTGGGRSEQILGGYPTANFFRLLGVQPLLGRAFVDGEDTPGHERVVVLRYGFWKRYFGSDPGAIGKAIMLNGNSYTIVGVMRLEFRFSEDVEHGHRLSSRASKPYFFVR